jgi:hypothetical protein
VATSRDTSWTIDPARPGTPRTLGITDRPANKANWFVVGLD